MGDIGSIIGGVGAAAGAGSSIASGLQGKKAQSAYQKQLNDLIGQTTGSADQIMKSTSPLRSLTTANLAAVLGGARTDQLQVFAPERQALEAQFGRAKDNIIAGGQFGGQLNRSLSDLESNRAQAIAGLEADVRRKAFEDALRVGFGVAPQQVFGAFGGATSALANQANMAAQQQASAGAGLGQSAALGALLSLKGNKNG